MICDLCGKVTESTTSIGGGDFCSHCTRELNVARAELLKRRDLHRQQPIRGCTEDDCIRYYKLPTGPLLTRWYNDRDGSTHLDKERLYAPKPVGTDFASHLKDTAVTMARVVAVGRISNGVATVAYDPAIGGRA